MSMIGRDFRSMSICWPNNLCQMISLHVINKDVIFIINVTDMMS